MTTILKGYRVKPENSVAGCGTFSAFPDRSQKVAPLLAANGNIRNPRFENIRRLGSPIVESTPFVFKDKLYLLENFQECWNTAKPQFEEHDYLKDKVRIIDLGSGEIVAAPLIGYTFGIAFVWDNKVYVFAGNHHTAVEWRHVTELCMTCSDDLKNWTPPQTVLKALDGEHFFNFAVCRGKDSFVLLYETDDPQWPK
ncbi:MAG: hypothetical protein EOM73_16695, partial [Bacteroidia bacterium]|nr:hypothetical protein [Bacteroidia bacterium]